MIGADERCTLVLHASPPVLPDFFSWEEVGSLGVRIIQECHTFGGYAFIGRSLRWGLMYVIPGFLNIIVLLGSFIKPRLESKSTNHGVLLKR